METTLREVCQTESTYRHYKYMLELLQKRFHKPLEDILSTPHKSINSITKTFPELQTRKSFYAAICAITKHKSFEGYPHRHIWCQQAQKVNDEVRQRYENGMATEKQQKTYIPWDDILKAFDKVKTSEDFPTKEHLLLAMYTLEVPKRLDYGNTKIVTASTLEDAIQMQISGNMIWIPNDIKKNAVLILREYKTHKKYGTLEFTLSSDLTRVIRLSQKKEPRSHLFMIRGNKEPMNDTVFAKFSSRALSRLIGPGVTVNTLRHSIIKYVYENPKTTHRQRAELSRRMCHSIDMQSAYAYDVDL